MNAKNLYLAAVMVALTMGGSNPVSAAVTFEWATVGHPGNASDPLNDGSLPGIGSVLYVYRLAKHEVTNDQYVEFLNAVAADDANDLYSVTMGVNARGGITRSGLPGSFTYAVKASMGRKPVNFVSFFDAMRFVNWLHNGQPAGAQEAGTTETGVYTIGDGLSENRASGAQFFLPSETEWYKAAYHQPSSRGGDGDDYWLYPTASNSAPTIATDTATGDISNPGANVANYDDGADWNDQSGNVTTVGSAGAQSESFYGTLDQGGNVSEWCETAIPDAFGRVLRGGSFNVSEDWLSSSFEFHLDPASEYANFGFRVAGYAHCDPADIDCDGDVDLTDFGLFQDLFTGQP